MAITIKRRPSPEAWSTTPVASSMVQDRSPSGIDVLVIDRSKPWGSIGPLPSTLRPAASFDDAPRLQSIAPTPAPPKPSIFDALLEWVDKRSSVLMLMNANNGKGYRVLDYKPDTQQAVLQDPNATGRAGSIQAKLTEREAKLYFPLWR
jgi:hypothetical protein